MAHMMATVLVMICAGEPTAVRAAPGVRLLGNESATGLRHDASGSSDPGGEPRMRRLIQQLHTAREIYARELGKIDGDPGRAQANIDDAEAEISRVARSELEAGKALESERPFEAYDHVQIAVKLAGIVSDDALVQETLEMTLPAGRVRAQARDLFQALDSALKYLYGPAPSEDQEGAPPPEEIAKEQFKARTMAGPLRNALAQMRGQEETIRILDAMMREFDSLSGRSLNRFRWPLPPEVGPEDPEYLALARFLAISRKLDSLIGIQETIRGVRLMGSAGRSALGPLDHPGM